MFNLNKKTTALKSEMLDKIAEYEDIIGTIKNEQIKHSYEKDLIKFQEIAFDFNDKDKKPIAFS